MPSTHTEMCVSLLFMENKGVWHFSFNRYVQFNYKAESLNYSLFNVILTKYLKWMGYASIVFKVQES